LLGDYVFVKTSPIFVFALVLVGCTSTHPNASLTAEQAKTVAIRLANDKASKLYHCQPFQDSEPAQYVSNHWVWFERQGVGHEDIEALVELAADGSAQKVEIQLLDSQNLF
jgi:uncharacterized protein YcfL